MRYLHDDFRSFAFHAVEMEGSAQHFDPVVHGRDPHAQLFGFRVETYTVVLDADGVKAVFLAVLAGDYGLLRLCVLDHVGEGFLHQSVEIQLHGFVEVGQGIGQFQAACEAVDLIEIFGHGGQPGFQPAFLQGFRLQVV